jgi:hypothetical protein
MFRCLFYVSLFLLIIVAPVFSATDITVYSDKAGDVKCVSTPVDGELVEMYVVVTGNDALSSVSFHLNIQPRLIWIEDEAVFAQTEGPSPIGTAISFDGCLSPTIHVLTVRCLVSQWDYYQGCPYIFVEGASGTDCSGQTVSVRGGTTRVPKGACEIAGPSNPSPPDHAQDVPLDALLTWTGAPADECGDMGPGMYFSLYFGTNPNPPLILQPGTWPPQDPGDLHPGTQYYWRVLATQLNRNSKLSPLWTFRTAGPVATEPTTWGRIKSLYRN